MEQTLTQPKDFTDWDNRRFYAYTSYLKRKYGGRVQKVSINASFTCPNRDGKVGKGGCTFCNNSSFTPSYITPKSTITHQLNEGLGFLEKRYNRSKHFVGYFQSYTNTYGSLDELKEVYTEALSHPKISGLVIGTRPDCIDEAQLDYLQELAEKHIIVLEYGIESCYNDTLDRVNRGHSFEDTIKALEMSKNRGFQVGGHLLFGLPGDDRQRMLDQVDLINDLPLDTIKFHQLQIVKGTIMAKQYRENPDFIKLFNKDEYIDFIVEFVERLRPDISIQRFSSEAPPNIKLAPDWGKLRMDQILNQIEAKLKEKDTWQGKLFL
ncbi:hypothetical protein BC781_103320 [Sediminitomix flava]|uniref:Radical SAM core domain-containing protein n=2 Tax=Sediminitomix flava TaxID=379075 RepID=A0A315Z9I5_SEDFL|nr:hypothetical protein BC781_103320 [Sediminitomix flava]